MDGIEFLTAQHRKLEGQFADALAAKDAATRRKLLAGVGDLLMVHIASEEEVFYPAVKAARTEDILLESLEEHLSLKRLLADLLALDPSGETFEPKLKVLAEQGEHHHEEEEEGLFPKVRKALDEKALKRLGEEMLALQQRMEEAGSPRNTAAEQTDEAAPL